MNFKYAWKKLSEDGLLKDVRDDYNGYIFSEYDTEEEALEDVKEKLKHNFLRIPNELVLIKLVNIAWEDRK